MADRDCVFAAAYCTALAHGQDPGSFEIVYNQLKYYEKTFRAVFVQYKDDSLSSDQGKKRRKFKVHDFIYLFIITLLQVCQGSASNWCLQPKNTSYTYVIITLTNYNLAIVFESLMVMMVKLVPIVYADQ